MILFAWNDNGNASEITVKQPKNRFEILQWALQKYPNITHGEDGMKLFLKNPYDFPFGNFWILANRNFKDKDQETLNKMFFLWNESLEMILPKNLGFSAFIDDQNKINETVVTIMKRFDLIMISDYMDESQVSL